MAHLADIYYDPSHPAGPKVTVRHQHYTRLALANGTKLKRKAEQKINILMTSSGCKGRLRDQLERSVYFL
uniref:Uncharacterized protein n=1 Tax=Timema monikensis TaxID=170555 RepID=A0A7R9E9Z5_9NEOP|nr:unnamed protein product [Timema monikensis]